MTSSLHPSNSLLPETAGSLLLSGVMLLLTALPCCPQGHPLSRLGIVAYLFVMHVLLVLCSFSSRHGPVP